MPVNGVDACVALDRALQEAYAADESKDSAGTSQEIEEFESRLASGRALHSRGRGPVGTASLALAGLGRGGGGRHPPKVRGEGSPGITATRGGISTTSCSTQRPTLSETEMLKRAEVEQDIQDVLLLRNPGSASDNDE
ncbi:unnamed protein product [Phytomonas sp. EM1]|nr:unnamed protein product [Phytomonas sp. EM1]|eukprot:CCW62335.1 unnamed protein product [Phytomonas sp. isolate EM1]